MQFNTIYIPYEGRAKYPENNPSQVVMQSGNGGGGGIIGGVGSTEYMTAFQTDTNAGTWNVSGITSLTSITDGTAILVRFNTDSNSGLSANTINIGLPAGEDSGETYPYPIYLQTGQLVSNEIKAGDELMLTYRDDVSGWTIDASNERYARDLWHKLTMSGFNVTSGIVAYSPYTVASSGDVLSYGESTYSGWTELSVIDNLTTDTEPHGSYALSANMGKELNDKLLQLSGSTITEFKTINGASIIGQGNIEIVGGGSGGTGTFVVGSGLTYDSGTSEYRIADSVFEWIDSKYDKTGGYVSGSVIASGDVISYGMSDFTGLSLSVIDNYNSTSATDALSANKGRELNEKLTDLSANTITEFKTINGSAITGTGNLVIEGGSGGGTEYTGGTNIGINNYIISVTGRVESASTSLSADTAGDSAKLGGSAATDFAKVSQINALNDALDLKYDKTGGTVNGSVHATGTVSADGDVMSYGASSVVPTGITVVTGLTYSTNDTNHVLNAYGGYVLSGMVNTKQEKLVSGTNIKTINGQSLLGSGNIEIQGGGGGTQYYEGSGISIANSTISVSAPLFAEIYGKANSAGTYTGLTVGSAASATTSKSATTAISAVSATTSKSATTAVSATTAKSATTSVSATTAKSATTAGDSAKLGGSAATEFAKTIDLDLKYDKTGGTITGNVQVSGTIEATKDIMTYGASSIVPTGITVQDNLTTSSTTNANKNVLSARQGYLLNRDKQAKLIGSGTGQNIKTINGQNILGTGNIVVEGGGASYSPGTNISISNGTISVTGAVQSAITSVSATTAKSATTATSSTNATYASNLGTSSASYTKSSLDTALNGKLGTGDTAANASKLGNVAASGYLTTGGTAYDSDRLGGTAASSYAKTNGTYSQMTVGTASESTYASRLGQSGAYYTKDSLDTALNGKLGTGGTAANSDKLGNVAASGYAQTGGTYSSMSVGTATTWNGYKIYVGSIPSSPRSDTIYFGI